MVLLNDQFTTNGSISTATTQGLPTSARWYNGGLTADANVTSGTLVFGNITTSSTRGGVAYFTSSGNYATLSNPGDYVKLSFSYSYGATDTDSNAFRFGLYSSNGSRLTTDNSGFNNAAVSPWYGYNVGSTFGTVASTRYFIYDRTSGANNLVGVGNAQLGTGIIPSYSSTANTTYSASLTLTKTEAGVSAESVINGLSLVREDTASPHTNFDTLTIMTSADTVQSLTVSNVLLEYYAIPEPRTWALLGLGALILGGMARRRRS